jgi:hypothetical protein
MEVCIKTLVIFLNEEGAQSEEGGSKILFANAHKGETKRNQVPFRERFILPNKCMSNQILQNSFSKTCCTLGGGGGRGTPCPSRCYPSDDANLNSHGPSPMQNVGTQMVFCIFECILFNPNKVKDERSQMLMGWSSNVKELKELKARVPMD